MIKLTSNVVSVHNNVTKTIDRVKVRLPQTAFRYCQVARDNLRKGMRGNRWTGLTEQSIVVIKRNKNESSVYGDISAVYLDRNSPPHSIKLAQNTIIRLWAYSKGNAKIREIADRQGWIKVRGHPYIKDALAETRTQLKAILLEQVKQ